MSLRNRALRSPVAAALTLLSLVLLARASAQQLSYVVPDFTGETYQQVQQLAVYPHTGRQVFASIDGPASASDTVVRQSPAPHTVIKADAKKQVLHLSWQPTAAQPAAPGFLGQLLGQIANAQSVVPPLKGVNATEASRRLASAGLRGIFTPGNGGIVIGVQPAEKSVVPRGSQVNVTMGTQVPSLTGQTVDAAQRMLADSGLQLGSIATPNGAGGTVTVSDPQAETVVPLNSSVGITLSGSAPPPPPTAGGITGDGVDQGVQLPPAQGDVPPTEQLQAPDATVRQPSQVMVPDVRDEVSSEAANELNQAGLRVAVSVQTTWFSGTTGAVVAQLPLPGTMVPPNSSVRIVIAENIILANTTLIGAAILAIALIGGGIWVKIWRPAVTAHCTFVPQIRAHQITITEDGPAIGFNLTLRNVPGARKYSLNQQPSVKKVSGKS
jgi:beta-lactam-binding protein with PASTA domain